jgi:hypothetical protein
VIDGPGPAASEIAETDAFRAEVRDWIARNFPLSLKGHGELAFHLNPDPANLDYDLWRRRMGEMDAVRENAPIEMRTARR